MRRALFALLALTLVAVGAACSSEPAPPADAEELRNRVAAALRAEPGRVLHIEESRSAEGGTFEVVRETWIDRDADTVRHAFHGTSGDDPPLTLVIDGEVYYPPSPAHQTFVVNIVGHTLEAADVLVFGLFLLELTDDSATVVEAKFEGDRVWRLEQDGVSAMFDDGESICFNARIDIDASTSLPRSVGGADCGESRPSSILMTATWLDRDDLPDDFFSPAAAAFDLLASNLGALRDGSPMTYWLGETYSDFHLDRVVPWHDGRAGSNASLRYRTHAISGGTIEIFFAPAGSVREWMCDFRGSPPAETASLSFTEAEACFYSDNLGQLRFTIGGTSILIDANGVHRDELNRIAEALRPLDAAP
jgi:hypothetical protein